MKNFLSLLVRSGFFAAVSFITVSQLVTILVFRDGAPLPNFPFALLTLTLLFGSIFATVHHKGVVTIKSSLLVGLGIVSTITAIVSFAGNKTVFEPLAVCAILLYAAVIGLGGYIGASLGSR